MFAAFLAAFPANAAPDLEQCKGKCIQGVISSGNNNGNNGAGNNGNNGKKPPTIEVQSDMTFNRMALRGRMDGSAELDPVTGETIPDENLIKLSGLSLQGRASIQGEPFKPVLIEMPANVQLRSPQGAVAVLDDFQTDLPPAPVLDEFGRLEFNFGARVTTTEARGGNFRGKIRIRVDYF